MDVEQASVYRCFSWVQSGRTRLLNKNATDIGASVAIHIVYIKQRLVFAVMQRRAYTIVCKQAPMLNLT
jgi:hypothetical protein